MTDRQDVVVVGGGVTGLATAFALEREAARRRLALGVTLLEGSGRLGGKVATDRLGRLLVERGPDALFLRSAFALDLLRELGLGGEIVRASAEHRQASVLWRGRLHALPPGMESGVPRAVRPMLATRLLSPLGKLRAGLEVALPARPGTADESIDAFVRRRFGAEVADRIAAPLLGGIYSGDTRELSLGATLAHLRAWELQHRSLLLASWTGHLPRPATDAAAASPFITLRSGLECLVGALRARLATTQVRLDSPVRRIRRGGAPGRERLLVETDNGGQLAARTVVVTTPAFTAAEILADLDSQAADALAAIHYASVVVVGLAFQPGSATLPPGSGFVSAPTEPGILAACSWASQKWPHCAPGGEVLVRAHLHADRRPDLLALDDRAIVEEVRAELAALVGIKAAPTAVRVYRWPRSVAAYTLGHRERLATVEHSLAELPGVVLAGAGYRGGGVPECLRQGFEAASRALDLAASSADRAAGATLGA